MHHTAVDAHPVYYIYKHQMIQLIVASTSVLQKMYICPKLIQLCVAFTSVLQKMYICHGMFQLFVAFTLVLQKMYICHVDAGKEYPL